MAMHGQCTALHAAAPPQRNPQGCFDGDSWAGVGQLPSVLTAHPSAQGKVREEGTAAILTSAVVPRQLLKAVLIVTKGWGLVIQTAAVPMFRGELLRRSLRAAEEQLWTHGVKGREGAGRGGRGGGDAPFSPHPTLFQSKMDGITFPQLESVCSWQ